MKYENEYVLIYSMRIAMELIKCGHRVAATMPNPEKQEFMMWSFEKDDTIIDDLNILRKGGSINGRK